MVYFMEQKAFARNGTLEITNERGTMVYLAKMYYHFLGSEQVLLSADEQECGRIKRIMNAYVVLPHYKISVGGQSFKIRRKFSFNSDYVIEGENIEIVGDMTQYHMVVFNDQRKRLATIDRVSNNTSCGKYQINIDSEFCTQEDPYYILIAIATRNAIKAIRDVQK